MSAFSRILLSAAIGAALAGQAFAHAHLESSIPANKATVSTSPTELDLTFSEELALKFSGIKIVGPVKKTIETGAAMLKDGDKTLIVPISNRLDSGRYTVQWHALSADGHKTKGTYSFTVKP